MPEMFSLLACAASAAVLAAPASAQISSSAPSVAGMGPAPASPRTEIPALTPVRIEILATLTSRYSKSGDHFPIRLATPLNVAPGLDIPAGTSGSGDVVQAAKSGMGGKPGELTLAVRYLDFGNVRIPLRSLRYFSPEGKDRNGIAMGLAIAGGLVGTVAAIFVSGGEVTIPTGTFAFAKTSAAVVLPPDTSISPDQQRGQHQ